MVAKEAEQDKAGRNRTKALYCDIGRDPLCWELARNSKSHRDCGVDVSAGNVTQSVHHHHDHQPEYQRDPQMSDGSVGDFVDHHRPRTGKHEDERANELCD